MKIGDGYRVILTHRSKYVAAIGTIRLLPNETNTVLIDWDIGESARVDISFFGHNWIYVAKDEKEVLAMILKMNG
jgi:hypothetical protein